MNEINNTTDDNLVKPEIQFIRVYTKDLSFEAPNTPEVFKAKWAPELKLEIEISATPLPEEAFYEVVLHLTTHVTNENKPAFVIDVKQAAIFKITNVAPENLEQILKIFCPYTIYPYARETVSDLVNRGNFPQLLLVPINFEAMFEQEKARQAQNTTTTVQ